ncbi:hypothetical protein [Methylophilus sp. Leaf408]|uniref:hypothetical protein n=1 Tax=Methylophilus sp. Leaf408 TaxID=2876561 RepID=UPI001E2D861C|nr:hypothetical protein [Methylophilus sp. Leaf408]
MSGGLLLIAAGTAQADLKDIYRIYHTQPSLTSFEICQGGGCTHSDTLKLAESEWDHILRIFSPLPETAEQERIQIAEAIGMLEDIVGTKTGTAADRAGTFGNSDYQHQQDCNDEAINSTTYMRLMQQAGLIRFHTIQDTRTRKFFFTGWPHSTAVIRENDTQAEFAVDSWFYDNGHAATIVPMAQWKDGYIPEDSPIHHRE